MNLIGTTIQNGSQLAQVTRVFLLKERKLEKVSFSPLSLYKIYKIGVDKYPFCNDEREKLLNDDT